MASNSALLAHGHEELSNVMQELKEWKASLKMPIKICNNKGEFLTKTYDDTNILQYTSEIWKGYKIYLDLSKYPIYDGFKNSNGWKELQHLLRLQAQSAGYDIVSNGCPTKDRSNQHKHCCHQSILYFNTSRSWLAVIEDLH